VIKKDWMIFVDECDCYWDYLNYVAATSLVNSAPSQSRCWRYD
jgi:hypothetical protein